MGWMGEGSVNQLPPYLGAKDKIVDTGQVQRYIKQLLQGWGSSSNTNTKTNTDIDTNENTDTNTSVNQSPPYLGAIDKIVDTDRRPKIHQADCNGGGHHH